MSTRTKGLTRRDKEALLSLMLRGSIETFRGETEAQAVSRLIRKGMVTASRPLAQLIQRTKYTLTDAGFAAAKKFMGREGQKPDWQIEFNAREKLRNPKYRKSKIAGRNLDVRGQAG